MSKIIIRVLYPRFKAHRYYYSFPPLLSIEKNLVSFRKNQRLNIGESITINHYINRIKTKMHIIILYRSLKSLNKIQHPFLIKQNEDIKNFKKLGMQRNLFNLMKTFLSGSISVS